MIGRARTCLAAAALLAAGCERDDRPLDGGFPIEFETMPGDAEIFAAQYCARREKGGWHRSVGHCMEMTPSAAIEGVVIHAFEERSFLPGLKERPDPRDPRRFMIDIELDWEDVLRTVGEDPGRPGERAIYLRFVGRRTRYPDSIDCLGRPYFTFVVDRLIEARDIGPVEELPPDWFDDLARKARGMTVTRRHSGRVGELEQEAIERCAPSAGGRDAEWGESGVPDDQTPAQARPPGNSSAE